MPDSSSELLHPDLPEHFEEACLSLFAVPTSDRVFICRTFTSKPFRGGMTPSCYVLRAPNLAAAEVLTDCLRGILDWVYLETAKPEPITPAEVRAIIVTLQRRCLLLTFDLAVEMFSDMGVPLDSAADDSDLVMLLDPMAGFDADKIEAIMGWVPETW